MKIVQFIDSMTSGGAETLVKDYAVEMNHTQDVCVLCYSIKRGTNNEKELENNKVREIFLAEKIFENKKMKRYKETAWRYFVQILFTIKECKKVLIELSPDIIHMHLNTIFLYPFIDRKLRKQIKVFYTIHSNEPDKMWPKFLYKIRMHILRQFKEIQVIVLQEGMKEAVSRTIDSKRIHVVNNGVQIEKYANVSGSKSDIKKQIGVPENSFVVGHVGRYTAAKNHLFLLEIFREVYHENKNAYLLLVGYGEEEENINNAAKRLGIEKNIKMITGSTNIPELLKAMDIFVFPSKNEGFGIALLEAEIANLPCVVSDAITEEVIISPNVKVVSLNQPASMWKKEIMNFKTVQFNKEVFNSYDIKVIVNKVIGLYKI